MSIRTSLLLVPVILMAGAQTAEASDGARAGAALLELVGLLLAFSCFLVSWKVLAVVRGGKLASAWQWVTSASFLFATGQALAFLGYLAFVQVAEDMIVFLRIAGLVLLLFGMLKMRRALS